MSTPSRFRDRVAVWASRPDVARMLASTLVMTVAVAAIAVHGVLPHRDTAVEIAAEAGRIEAALNEAFVEPIRYEQPLGLGDASDPDTLGYLVVSGIIYDCSAQLPSPEDTFDAPFVACEGPVPQLTPEDRFVAS